MIKTLQRVLDTLILAGVISLAACAPHTPPPTPEPPPAQIIRLVQATVRSEATNEVPAGAKFILFADTSGTTLNCPFIGSRAVCTLDDRYPVGVGDEIYGGNITITAPDHETAHVRINLTGRSQDLDDIPVKLSFKPLVRIHPEGQHFRQDDNGRIFIAEKTDFNLLARYVQGEDITPILAQRRDLGFNALRVFTAFDVPLIGQLIPRAHPEMYSRIPAFLDLAAKYLLRVEIVAFTGGCYEGGLCAGDHYPFFHGDGEKIQHWVSLCSAVQGKTNVFLEMINEGDNTPNLGIPLDSLAPCPGVLTSRGSATEDARPMEPFSDYITFHPARGEFQRKAGHNCMELWSGPCVSNEISRSPDVDGNNQHWYDAGVNCALLAAGCTFHSVQGKDSRLLTGTALENAKAFIEGVRSIPLEVCQDQAYHRRDDLLDKPPFPLRAHQRGNDTRCLSLPRP